MTFSYTDKIVLIAPFVDRSEHYIEIQKPSEVNGKRVEARVSWSRFKCQYPGAAYDFAQGLFLAAGIADVLNLIPDLELVKEFGVVTD